MLPKILLRSFQQLLVGSSRINQSLNGLKPLVQKPFTYFQTNVARREFSNFFTSNSGTSLWDGVVGDPNKKKRARGKRRIVRPRVNLNVGQDVGQGKSSIGFPGLNLPINLQSDSTSKISQIEANPLYEKNLQERRNARAFKRRSRAIAPLHRGWSGNKIGGKSLGPPEPVGDCLFTGFDTRCLECRVVSSMTSIRGRTPRFAFLAAAGNGKGVGGLARVKSLTMRAAIRKGKNKAVKNLERFEFYENRTLWHPAFEQQWKTKIIAFPASPGTGLICHRLIKTICQLVGIKDIYVKVEGNAQNYVSIARGFFNLLRAQEDYQSLSDREQLNVVEFSRDRDNIPHVLASPSQGFSRSVDPEEDLDMERYYFQGRVPYLKRQLPAYLNLPGQVRARELRWRFRNLADARFQLVLLQALHGGQEAYERIVKQTGASYSLDDLARPV